LKLGFFMASISTPQSGIAFAGSQPADLFSAKRRRDLLEFWTAYALIALAIWAPPLWQRALAVAALAWVVWSTVRSFDGWRAMGFRVSGFWSSAWVIPTVLGLAGVAILVAAQIGTLHAPPTAGLFLQRYGGYAVWSFLQEFLLLNFFLLRLLRLVSGRHAAALAASSLFALVHLPNPVLTPLTLLWGYASCLLFLRYRNLYVPAVCHAILGITIAITVPGPVDHNMRVGLGYLTYREHHHRATPTAARSTTPYRPLRG
jgi:membrane protease YdiL (CAAX protease family)